MARRHEDPPIEDPGVEPRPQRQPRDRAAPSRVGSIRVGPGGSRPAELRQTRITTAPGLPATSARRFAIGPDVDGAASGLVGWQTVEDLPLDLPDGHREIAAIVSYPARRNVDAFGRVLEGFSPAVTLGGWPVVVLVHGIAPSKLGLDDRDAPCGERLVEGQPIGLYARWHSTQRDLARAGYVSIAPDMSWRDPPFVTDTARGSPEAVEAVRQWVLTAERSVAAPVCDSTRVGFVGHSLGAHEVDQVAVEQGAQATAVLAPVPNIDEFGQEVMGHLLYPLPANNLVVGSRSDAVNGSPVSVYRRADSPRHMLLIEHASHYAFLDGLCGSGMTDRRTPEDAGVQRSLARRALLAFLDRYLRGLPIPDDLGLGADEPGVDSICFDDGQGHVLGACDE